MLIFTVTNTTTQQVYVGSTRNQLDIQWSRIVKASGLDLDYPLYREIRVHGEENFRIDEWDFAEDRRELAKLEKQALEVLNARSLRGYKSDQVSAKDVEAKPVRRRRIVRKSAPKSADAAPERAPARTTVAASTPKINTWETQNGSGQSVVRFDRKGEKTASISRRSYAEVKDDYVDDEFLIEEPSAALGVDKEPSAEPSFDKEPSATLSFDKEPSAALGFDKEPSATLGVDKEPSAELSLDKEPLAPEAPFATQEPSAAIMALDEQDAISTEQPSFEIPKTNKRRSTLDTSALLADAQNALQQLIAKPAPVAEPAPALVAVVEDAEVAADIAPVLEVAQPLSAEELRAQRIEAAILRQRERMNDKQTLSLRQQIKQGLSLLDEQVSKLNTRQQSAA